MPSRCHGFRRCGSCSNVDRNLQARLHQSCSKLKQHESEAAHVDQHTVRQHNQNQHTVIFVPHARAKFRKWRFTSLQAGLLLGILLFLSLIGIVSSIALFSVSLDRSQLARIQQENRDLHAVTAGFEKSIGNLEQQLADYQDRIHKLAIVAGLAELSPTSEAGIGGGDPQQDEANLSSELLALEAQISHLDLGMNLLQQRFDERRLLISSTPAIVPVKGIFTSGFGVRKDPFTGQPALHRGVDFIAPPGQDVFATADGIVTHAGRDEGLGIAVYVSHGFGITTVYGHLSRVAVQPGQRVRRGELVGFVGNTGRATGYHLHYEVHVDGKPSNPLGYILTDVDL